MGPVKAAPDCSVIFHLDVLRVKLPLWMSVPGLAGQPLSPVHPCGMSTLDQGQAHPSHVLPPFDVRVCAQMTAPLPLKSVRACAQLPLHFYFGEERALRSAFELEKRRHTWLMAVPNT